MADDTLRQTLEEVDTDAVMNTITDTADQLIPPIQEVLSTEDILEFDYAENSTIVDDNASEDPLNFDYAANSVPRQPTVSEYVGFAEVQEGVKWQTLKENNSWLHASHLMFTAVHGIEPKLVDGSVNPVAMDILNEYGEKEDSFESKLANYALKEMAGFNFNIIDMAVDANTITSLGEKDLETKKAFLYLMNQYDATDMSWKTTGDATWAVLTDWTNYAGLTAAGVGVIGTQGARLTGKTAAKELLEASIRKGVRASAEKVGLNTVTKQSGALLFLEGAAHMGYYQDTYQDVTLDIQADSFGLDEEDKAEFIDENYSTLSTLGMAALGGATSMVFGLGLAYGIDKLYSKRINKKLDELQEKTSAEIRKNAEELANRIEENPVTIAARILESDLPPAETLARIQQEAAEEAFDLVEEIVEVPFVSPKLPSQLRSVKPRYYRNIDGNNTRIILNWADDVSKALYIVGNLKKSAKYHEEFVAFLKANGIQNIDQQAARIRASIKEQADQGATEVLVSWDKPNTMLRKVKTKKPRKPEEATTVPATVSAPKKVTKGEYEVTVDDTAFNIKKNDKGRWEVTSKDGEAPEGTFKSRKEAIENLQSKPKKADTETTVKLDEDGRPIIDRLSGRIFKNTADILRRITNNPHYIDDVLNDIDTERYTLRETEAMLTNFNEAYMVLSHRVLDIEAKLTDPNLTAELRDNLLRQLRDAQEIEDAGFRLIEHLNAFSGRNLQDIQNWKVYQRNPDGTMKTEAIKAQHIKYFEKMIDRQMKKHQPAIDKAIDDGDMQTALELMRKRESSFALNTLFNKLEEFDPERAAKLRREKLQTDTTPDATVSEKFLELAVSGVFSPTTVQYNVVVPALKMYTMPLLDELAQNPLKMAAWRKTINMYSQMLSQTKAASIAARTAAELEQTPLTGDPDRFLEGGTKNVGKFLGIIPYKMLRFFPRLVNSSDAFIQENVAAGFVTSSSMDRLLSEAFEKGLKGKDAWNYVEERLEKEIAKGYDDTLTEQAIKPLLEEANKRGFKTLEEKEAYILKQFKKIGRGGFKRLTDKEAVSFVRDFLYKKEFKMMPKDKNGNKIAEYDFLSNPIRAAAERGEHYSGAWEKNIQKRAWLKAITTIFWRTPVRLVNESFRLTPVLQQLMPTFVDDLAGLNGAARKARATTEAFTGYSVLMWAISKYAMNEITGSQNLNYSKTAERNNTQEIPPLTIDFDSALIDGELSYRRIEPFRLPIQLLVDTLDSIQADQKLRGMGDYGEEYTLDERAYANLAIVTGSFMQASRDTGTFTGITDTIGDSVKAADSFAKGQADGQEGGFKILGKLAMEKLTMPIPSTAKKIQIALGSDVITKPYGFGDKLVSMIDVDSPSLPIEYDQLGYPRRYPNKMESVFGFLDPLTEEEKKDINPHSAEEEEILRYLQDLEDLDLANTSKPFYKSKSQFGDEDLRNIKVEVKGVGGTIYNVPLHNLIAEELRKDVELRNSLLRAARSNAPLGTPNAATKSQRVKSTIDLLGASKRAAILRIAQKYPEVHKLIMKHRNTTKQEEMAN